MIIIRNLLMFILFSSTSALALDAKVSKSDKDVLVPVILTQEIEQNFIKKVREEDPKEIRTDLQLKMEIPRQMLSLDLYLDKMGGKSLDDDLRFEIPPGGANLDLAQYIRQGRGLFQLRAEFTGDFNEEDLEALKVYFVPRYHRHVKEGEVRGVGCDRFVEITKFFKSKILGDGLLLTTTQQAYFPVIAGSYIMVVTHQSGLKVASLSLMDSRFKNFLCPVKPGR